LLVDLLIRERRSILPLQLLALNDKAAELVIAALVSLDLSAIWERACSNVCPHGCITRICTRRAAQPGRWIESPAQRHAGEMPSVRRLARWGGRGTAGAPPPRAASSPRPRRRGRRCGCGGG